MLSFKRFLVKQSPLTECLHEDKETLDSLNEMQSGATVEDYAILEYIFDVEYDLLSEDINLSTLNESMADIWNTIKTKMKTSKGEDDAIRHIENTDDLEQHEKQTIIKNIRQYYKDREVVEANVKDYTRLIKRAVSGDRSTKILVDIKGLASWLDKTIMRKKTRIDDFLRGAILTSDGDTAKAVAERLRKLGDTVEYEVKEFNQDKKYGYFGSYHIKTRLADTIAEIQVMPKRLWTYKGEAHKIYDALRTPGDIDAKVQDMMLRKSKELFVRGNQPRRR